MKYQATNEDAVLNAIAKATAKADTFKKRAADLIRRVAPQNISKCDAANQLFNELIIKK